MYAIYTRSKREPYYLEDDTAGAELAEQWLHGKLPPKVKLGNVVMESSQIKSVESNVNPKDNDDWLEEALNDKKLAYTNYVRQCDTEYEAYRTQRQARGVDVNASDLAVAELVWLAHTGSRNIPEDAAQAIVERQRAFLESNPNMTRVNPTVYKDVVKPYANNPSWKNSTMAKYCMALVERIVAADKFA